MILLARVLHDFHDEAGLQLLRTAYAALKPQGRIGLIESLGLQKVHLGHGIVM